MSSKTETSSSLLQQASSISLAAWSHWDTPWHTGVYIGTTGYTPRHPAVMSCTRRVTEVKNSSGMVLPMLQSSVPQMWHRGRYELPLILHVIQ